MASHPHLKVLRSMTLYVSSLQGELDKSRRSCQAEKTASLRLQAQIDSMHQFGNAQVHGLQARILQLEMQLRDAVAAVDSERAYHFDRAAMDRKEFEDQRNDLLGQLASQASLHGEISAKFAAAADQQAVERREHSDATELHEKELILLENHYTSEVECLSGKLTDASGERHTLLQRISCLEADLKDRPNLNIIQQLEAKLAAQKVEIKQLRLVQEEHSRCVSATALLVEGGRLASSESHVDCADVQHTPPPPPLHVLLGLTSDAAMMMVQVRQLQRSFKDSQTSLRQQLQALSTPATNSHWKLSVQKMLHVFHETRDREEVAANLVVGLLLSCTALMLHHTDTSHVNPDITSVIAKAIARITQLMGQTDASFIQDQLKLLDKQIKCKPASA